MKRYRGPLVFGALCLAFAIALFGLLQVGNKPASPRQDMGLRVVVYGDAERWRSLDQGIAQACSELAIEKPVLYVSSAQADDAQEQADILRRELARGAKGFLVAAADSALLAPVLEEISAEAPVVMVETGAGDTLPCISADDAEMGRALARQLAGKFTAVTVVETELARSSARARYNAFMAEAEALGIRTAVWKVDVGAGRGAEQISQRIGYQKPAVLAALDNEALEAAAGAVAGAKNRVALYGIGNSNKIVHALDSGQVDAICFQNEFSIGYLGIMRLAENMKLAGAAPDGGVEFRMVSRETMYDPDVERLLFPIIQ